MAYAQRYAGGFVNGNNAKQVDDVFLNAVEAALLKLLSADGTVDGQALQWIAAQSKFGPALLLNKNIDAAAAIAKSKLDFTGGNGIVNADIAGAAAIAKSKLNLASSIVQPTDFSAGSKITTGLYASGPPGGPTDGDIWIGTQVSGTVQHWIFQYDSTAIADAYKWVFLGGLPVFVYDTGPFSKAATAAWLDVGNTPLAVTRAGIYDCSILAVLHNTGASAAESDIGLSIDGVDPASLDNATLYSGATGPQASGLWTYYNKTIAAAGVIKARYLSQLTSTFVNVKVSYIPRRIA